MDLKIRDLFSESSGGLYKYIGKHQIKLGDIIIIPEQYVDLLQLELRSDFEDNADLQVDLIDEVFYVR